MDVEPLELRTHTRLWQVEKKLYKLYDYTLPMPVSLRMLGIFILSLAVWIPLCIVLRIPFAPPFGHLIWLAPPLALTYFGNKPVAEGKRLGELLASNISYFLSQPNEIAALRPHTAPDTVYAHIDVWHPFDAVTSDAGDTSTASAG